MRNPKRDEMVIMGTCQQTKRPFGITVEKQGKDYVFTWAFKINAKAAKREGEYPGCPHCGAPSWFQCGKCKRFVCMPYDQKIVRCPECGNEGEIVLADKFDLSGGDL